MELILIVTGIAVAGYCAFKHGKRIGSRKGFNAGRRNRRRRQ